MRLLDSISSVNSKQGIEHVELEQPKLLNRNGVVLVVPILYHLY